MKNCKFGKYDLVIAVYKSLSNGYFLLENGGRGDHSVQFPYTVDYSDQDFPLAC